MNHPKVTTRLWSSSLLSRFDNFIFDCDGVLWRGNNVVPGVPKMIKTLQSEGKKIVLCSNNASKLREKYVGILAKHEVEIPLSNIYTSAYTAASYIANLSLTDFDPDKHKVLVCGTSTLNIELSSRGIKSVNIHDLLGVSSSKTHENDLVSQAIHHNLDPLIRVVVAGLDPKMNYASLGLVARYLRETPKTGSYKGLPRLFISTNIDTTYPAAEGILMPGAGSALAFLQAASGRTAKIMGKPEAHMLDAIITDLGWERSKTLMIGDRCDTDILFANQGGISSLLVLSGVSSMSTLKTSIASYLQSTKDAGESVTLDEQSLDDLGLFDVITSIADVSDDDSLTTLIPIVPSFIAPSAAWITADRKDEADCSLQEREQYNLLNA